MVPHECFLGVDHFDEGIDEFFRSLTKCDEETYRLVNR